MCRTLGSADRDMRSIQHEFIRLLALATVPLVLVLAYAVYGDYQTAYRDAEKSAMQIAEITTVATRDLVADVRVNLEHLARDPQIQAMQPDRCGSVVKDLQSVDPRFANIITTDRDGYVVCSANPLPADRKLRILDLEFMQQVVAQGEFGVGQPFRLQTNGRWGVPLANPVHDPAGKVVGMVSIAVDLVGWRFLAKTPTLPENSLIAIQSGDGTVIARSERADERVGRSALDYPIGRAALQIRNGTTSGLDSFGIERIFAFKTIPGTDWIAAVGFPLQGVREDSRGLVLTSGTLALLSLLLAAFAAVALKRRIVAPIRDMARVARAHAAGETETRVLVVRGPSELIELAEDLNRSTESRAAAERALLRAQQMAKLSHVITGPDGSFESWPDTLPLLIGIAPDRMPRSTREWLENLHPDDRATFRDKAIEAGRKGARTEVEYRLRSVDGSWIWIRQVMEPLEGHADDQGKGRWFNTVQDVTDQKEAEQRIRRLNRVYSVLSGINTLIVRVRDREELFRETCRLAVEQGRFHIAWIGFVGPDPSRLKLAAQHGGAPEYIEVLRGRDWLSANESGIRPAVGRVLVEKRAVFSNDIQTDPNIRYATDHMEQGTRSLAVLPLLVAGSVAGVLCLQST
jgi:PAS domain S-box-containing protein